MKETPEQETLRLVREEIETSGLKTSVEALAQQFRAIINASPVAGGLALALVGAEWAASE